MSVFASYFGYKRTGAAPTDIQAAEGQNGVICQLALSLGNLYLLAKMSQTNSTADRSPVFLRMALGLVYFHFGLLKFFPDLSPAELISTQTVMSVSWHWLDAHQAQLFLAVLETAIGLAFLFNALPRVTFALFMLHMVGTLMPLFVLPELTFKIAPLAPNIEGQYIFKNIVFVAAGWTVLMPQVFPRNQPVVVAPE